MASCASIPVREERPYKEKYDLLEAAASVSADYFEPSKWCSGCVSVSIPDRRLNPYLGDLRDGGVVLDKRPIADHPDFVRRVFDSPMVKLTLTDDAVQRCPQPDAVMAFGLAARKIAEPRWSGLDYVSLSTYAQMWAARGARIGVRHGDVILWADGEVQEIPPVELRWRCER